MVATLAGEERASAEVSLTLPWPPTVNTYWRHVGARVLISREGRAYRQRVDRCVLVAGRPRFGARRLAVQIDVFPPDRRRRDLDNLGKALLDALQAAGVYDDDGQIDLLLYRRRARGAGSVVVRIMEALPL